MFISAMLGLVEAQACKCIVSLQACYFKQNTWRYCEGFDFGFLRLLCISWTVFPKQDKEPKKASAQRNALASVLRLRRKIIKTFNESMDELNRQRKSIWWSRWIPREE